MNAAEHLQENAWKHPECYGGFSPDGDYLILSRNRDSDLLSESNWNCACKSLGAEAFDSGRDAEAFAERPNVYHWRAGHWACGWVEYLMVRADAPDDVQDAAGEIVCSLADYPVLNEDDFSEREFNAACEAWERYNLADRVDLCQRAGISIFAARRDDMPSDDSGFIQEQLTGC